MTHLLIAGYVFAARFVILTECAASIAFAYDVVPLPWRQFSVDTRFELVFSVPSVFRKSFDSGTSRYAAVVEL